MCKPLSQHCMYIFCFPCVLKNILSVLSFLHISARCKQHPEFSKFFCCLSPSRYITMWIIWNTVLQVICQQQSRILLDKDLLATVPLYASLGLSNRRVWQLWKGLYVHIHPYLGSNWLGHRTAHYGYVIYKKCPCDSNTNKQTCDWLSLWCRKFFQTVQWKRAILETISEFVGKIIEI